MTLNMVLTTAEVFPEEGPHDSLDLLTENRLTYATIQTLTLAKEDTEYRKPGIYNAKNGVIDVVLDVPNLTPQNVTEALTDLSKTTGVNYKLNL